MLLALSLASSGAQKGKTGSALPTNNSQQGGPEKATTAIESRPLHVKLDVVVTDGNHQWVNDVGKDRFHIFEDGVPQTLSLFEKKDQPPGFVLAVDCSLSMRARFQTILDAARFIEKKATADEKIMLLRFVSSDKIETVRDFTADHAAIGKAIDDLYLEGGHSAVIDAIYIANESMAAFTKDQGNVRRPLIIITDGEDRNSYYTQAALVARLRKTGTQVMILAFQQDLENQKAKDRAANLLNTLAQETGGNVYFPKSSVEIESAIDQMMMEIRAQYVVGYESSKPARDGTFRKVRVEIENPPGTPQRFAFVTDGFTVAKN